MSDNAGLPSTGRARDRAAVRSLQWSDVVMTYVVDGVVTLRASGFFPDVTAEQWQSWPDLFADHDTMLMSAGGLLVERGGHAVLIDTGLGPVDTRLPFGSVDGGSMLEVLGSLGKQPGDIDVVAFTHLHFDHAGWAFSEGANELQRRTFTNARYAVSEQELIHDHPDAMSERFVRPMAAAAEPIGDGEEVFPGVRALAVSGHTPGHMAYIIDTGTDARVIVLGDAFHSPAQISHPEWSAVADHDVAQAFAARRTLLTELARPNTIGFAYHFGDQPFGRVTTNETGTTTWTPIPAIAVAPPPRA
jgi:glyoxylase-like metal-dependent hydrolase (beta-lactamase superfamily II)